MLNCKISSKHFLLNIETLFKTSGKEKTFFKIFFKVADRQWCTATPVILYGTGV